MSLRELTGPSTHDRPIGTGGSGGAFGLRERPEWRAAARRRGSRLPPAQSSPQDPIAEPAEGERGARGSPERVLTLPFKSQGEGELKKGKTGF